jgi:hypothetical protein
VKLEQFLHSLPMKKQLVITHEKSALEFLVKEIISILRDHDWKFQWNIRPPMVRSWISNQDWNFYIASTKGFNLGFFPMVSIVLLDLFEHMDTCKLLSIYPLDT